MARIEVKMSYWGNENYYCTGCDKQFGCGEQMNAVVWDNGDPAGWFCDCCINNWEQLISRVRKGGD